MNQEKAKKILGSYGNPSFNLKSGTNLVFARESLKDVKDIEKMNDETLIKEWKGLIWINNIYGQVSLGDLQRIDLLSLEMECRKSLLLREDELKKWYKDSRKDFEIQINKQEENKDE